MSEAKHPEQNNVLHGMTLEAILNDLVLCLGWEKMADKIPINCFLHEPSIQSSLKFLRKTPWARQKVEVMFEFNYKKIQKLKSDLPSNKS